VTKSEDHSTSHRPWLIFLAWLIPGAGHFLLGERARAIAIFLAITITFWIGVIIGGARSTIDLQGNLAWFFAQVFVVTYTILTMFIGNLPEAMPSYGKTLDLATIYTGVAGLLNVFVILDVLGRMSPTKERSKRVK